MQTRLINWAYKTREHAVLNSLKALYIILVGCFIFGLIDTPASKHLDLRFSFYLLCLGVLPYIHLKWSNPKYPYKADYQILTLMYLDTLSNGFHFYDKLPFYDKLIHFVGPMLFVAAVYHVARPIQKLPPIWRCLCLVGIGCLGGALWEVYEFMNYLADSAWALHLSYQDTMVDLMTDILGSAILAFIATRSWAQKYLT